MEVVTLSPRGYCHGVVDAVKEMKRIAKDPSVPRPAHILGPVVHNEKIVRDFAELGLHTLSDKGKSRLELLDEIDEGTVVFTAHGVADAVYAKAEKKGLFIIDTTCKDVKRSQDAVRRHLEKGYDILFVGKKNHPESETAQSFGDKVHIIETETDIEELRIANDRVALTNQTTMSLYDIFHLGERAKTRFPRLKIIDEICDATRSRQEAVKNQPEVDHCFVVGDGRSNNTKKLVETAKMAGIPASLVESVEDLSIEHLKKLRKVSVTSGASTPSQLTREVVRFLADFDPSDPSTHDNRSAVRHKNLFR